jgi:hypothetical protein
MLPPFIQLKDHVRNVYKCNVISVPQASVICNIQAVSKKLLEESINFIT